MQNKPLGQQRRHSKRRFDEIIASNSRPPDFARDFKDDMNDDNFLHNAGNYDSETFTDGKILMGKFADRDTDASVEDFVDGNLLVGNFNCTCRHLVMDEFAPTVCRQVPGIVNGHKSFPDYGSQGPVTGTGGQWVYSHLRGRLGPDGLARRASSLQPPASNDSSLNGSVGNLNGLLENCVDGGKLLDKNFADRGTQPDGKFGVGKLC